MENRNKHILLFSFLALLSLDILTYSSWRLSVESRKEIQPYMDKAYEYEDYSTYIPNAVDAEAAVKYAISLK